MTVVVILVIAASILLLLNVLFGLVLSISISRPKNKTYLDGYFFTPFETGVPWENVAFKTDDDLTLRGWLLPGIDNRAVIGLCGRMGTKSDLLGVGSYLNRAGYNVLLFDYRGCGESDPSTMSMGQFERADVRASVDFIANRIPDPKIGIIGFSMGASLGIVHASEDNRILALVCDSPFTSSEELILKRVRRFLLLPPLPLSLLRLSLRLFTKLLYGYDNRGLDVKGSARKLSLRSLLVVVSEKDGVIPPARQREVFDSAPPPKEVWELEEADHCGAYFLNRGEYVEKVIAFFDDAL